MARINTYAKDATPSLDDKVLGSDFNSPNRTTSQYSFAQIQALLTELNTGALITSIYSENGGEADETDSGFFTSYPIDGVILTTTEIKINKISSQSQDLTGFFNIIKNYIDLPGASFIFTIKNSRDNTNFGLLNVTDVVESSQFFTLTVSEVTGAGSGNFTDETTYIFVSDFSDEIVDTGVQSVTGEGVDNTDPDNPIINARYIEDITWDELIASTTREAGQIYNITTAEPIGGIVYGIVSMATNDSIFITGNGDVEILNLYKDTEPPVLGDVSWAKTVPPPNSYTYFNVSMDTKSTDNIFVAGHIVLKRGGTDPDYTWTELDYIPGDTFTDYTIYRGGTNWPVTFRVDVVDASGNRTEGAEIYAP